MRVAHAAVLDRSAGFGDFVEPDSMDPWRAVAQSNVPRTVDMENGPIAPHDFQIGHALGGAP